MDAFRIISCPIEATPEQATKIEATLRAFADACNYVAERGKEAKVSAKPKLQKLCYYDVRGRFGLSANLAIATIQRVSQVVKASKKRDLCFRPTSADYDARTFSFRERGRGDSPDWTVSLTLNGGRERFPLKIGEWQKDALRGEESKSAVLCKKSNGRYYVDIRVRRKQPPEREASSGPGTLGVDMGVKNIATTAVLGGTDGTIYSSETLNAYRLERHRVRKSLQSKAAKGTRSANGNRSTRRNCRKALARLSGKERRRCREENHVLSRRIVDKAKADGLTIVLEDLTGIRSRMTGRLRRSQRGLHNSWSFIHLRWMIEYKAADAGVAVVVIAPRYTSQTCARCYYIGKRRGDDFNCPNCGNSDHSDKNAAKVIAAVGGAMSRPEQSAVCCAWHSAEGKVEISRLSRRR